MTGRLILRIVVWALLLGLLIALPVGGRQRFSVELWFAALAAWLLIGLTMSLIRAAPPHGDRSGSLLPFIARWASALHQRTEPESDQLKDHRYIEALIKRAVGNERSHARRLRPRLQALVDDQLRLHHGLDSATDPKRAAVIHQQMFGDTAWLLDPTVIDRAPTLDELDRFLHRLNHDTDTGRVADTMRSTETTAGDRHGHG